MITFSFPFTNNKHNVEHKTSSANKFQILFEVPFRVQVTAGRCFECFLLGKKTADYSGFNNSSSAWSTHTYVIFSFLLRQNKTIKQDWRRICFVLLMCCTQQQEAVRGTTGCQDAKYQLKPHFCSRSTCWARVTTTSTWTDMPPLTSPSGFDSCVNTGIFPRSAQCYLLAI